MNPDALRLTVVDAALTTALGLLMFVVVLWGISKIVPFPLWRELSEKRNPAVGVILLSVLVGLGIIVSAAIKPGS